MAISATVVCIRGPSGSGKTTLTEALVPRLIAGGLRTGFVKRSHHELDVAGKDSHRLAAAGATVLVQGAGGTTIFHRPDAELLTLLNLLPPDLDVVLVESFRPERFPVILVAGIEPGEREPLLARFDGHSAERPEEVAALAGLIAGLHRARATAAGPEPLHHVHRCAGAVLGRRLARLGAGLLRLEVPRADHRLFVLAENDGCAADALMAATGCRPGNRTLRFRYYGKLAVTFVDTETGRAVRVWAKGDCRAGAMLLYPDTDRHLAQLLAYSQLPDEALFGFRWTDPPGVPGARRRHLLCTACEEEVDGDAVVPLGEEAFCKPCAEARSRVANRSG